MSEDGSESGYAINMTHEDIVIADYSSSDNFLLKSPSDWIWSVVALSLAAWYLLHTLASALAGSTLNVPLPPLIAMRSSIVRGLKDFN